VSFNEPAAQGAENLVDTLDTIGGATLRLFGYRKTENGWTRDPAPGVPEGQVGHSQKQGEAKRRAQNDRLQWVPKFHGDKMQAGDPTPQPGGFLPGGNGGAPLPGVEAPKTRLVQRGDWIYKVDSSGRILWKRLSA
jgi:hypothetical protein